MGKAAALVQQKLDEFAVKFVVADNAKASSIDAETTKAVNELKAVAEDLKSRVETMENTVVQNTVKTVAIERHIGMDAPGQNGPQNAQQAYQQLQQKAATLGDTAQRDLTADALKTLVYGQ